MIELNLLPKELRKKKEKILPEIPVFAITTGIVLFAVASSFVVSYFVKRNTALSLSQDKHWKELQPQKKEAELLHSEIRSLEGRLQVTRDIANPDLDWARLLSELNQAMIPNVWLSGFKPLFRKEGTDKKNKAARKEVMYGIELSGYALGKSEATSAVGKFIESIKWNIEYFKDIELQGMRHQQFDGEEVMVFKLICKFKGPESSDADKNPGNKNK